jgi:Bardet-Biedl syndrome 5 protein
MANRDGDPDEIDVWQDREIRFDIHTEDLACRRGEYVIDNMEHVEDTKGNNGDRGVLSITNLRMVWRSAKRARTNLSIGYAAIISINIRAAQSRLRGNTHALYVLTKFSNSRFEFVFTNLVRNSPRLFTTIQAVFRAYDTTQMYRNLRLRGAIIQDKQLRLLPREEVYTHLSGVWNLSAEQGNLGTFVITNVRLVWHANMAESFNVSIPYLQMRSVQYRESKFGMAIVIKTNKRSGGYTLGFTVTPAERMEEVYREIRMLWTTFSDNPIFGVDFDVEEHVESIAEVTVPRREDDVEIDDEEVSDALAAYYADGAGDAGDADARPPAVHPVLGLAVEQPPEGITLEQLWNAV